VYPTIYEILKNEKHRQFKTVELIASENFASEDVRYLCGTVFTNKYAEGYPGARYYNGCEHMDDIERLALTFSLIQALTQTLRCIRHFSNQTIRYWVWILRPVVIYRTAHE
jgi:glycine/serine hydroxymethyltransferase